MEETKLQALHDSLSGHTNRKGLGTNRRQYSWAKKKNDAGDGANSKGVKSKPPARADGLPNNALYANFVKEGSFKSDGKKKGGRRVDDGDGRVIKRDFSDIPVLVDDGGTDSSDDSVSTTTKKKQRKAAKKAAKLEAKRQKKLEEKREAKRLLKLQAKERRRQQSRDKQQSGNRY